jgi:hypothetical protein
MPRAPTAQTVFPFCDHPEEVPRSERPDTAAGLDRLLRAAFADRSRRSGFLPQAEEAVRARPGDGHILLLAATAALLDEEPRRAQVFLKRFSKRYVATDSSHLLGALVLAQENKLEFARSVLEAHTLTSPFNALSVFPGGLARQAWLSQQYDRIFDRDKAPWHKRAVARKVKFPVKAKRSAAPDKRLRAHQAETRPRSLPPLPRIDIDIPLSAEIDLAPLLAASQMPPQSDGGWWSLRERFAHLGLAQGFDELLCLPHLRGVETFWYQVETVRKVLKQFRGRVLLADEVGLGKTIEAGMVLKEYLLRGMVDSVLVLTPASLVGQWREELETKLDIECATTHDALIRRDPERFWKQKRLIASLALARRSEHAARIVGRSFDMVIVDEAHHLRDRNSRSYKLVDALNKRFLLLLSATPVQNDLIELYNVLTLLKPGIFKTLKGRDAGQASRGGQSRALARALARRNGAQHARRGRAEAPAPSRHDGARRWPRRRAGGLPTARASGASAGERRGKPARPAASSGRGGIVPGGGRSGGAAFGRPPCRCGLARAGTALRLDRRRRQGGSAELLAREGFAFARFEGALSGPAKDAAIADFRERVPVLLCTESGGEGRNIQFCNTLINFDVPWNPMAIEQRIGRIDRIGQQREVYVFNLVTRGTLEEEILHLLEEKIAMFELVVGEVEAILGGLDEDRDFAELMLEAWLHTAEESRAEALNALGHRLQGARQQHERAKVLDAALFGEDFETA